MIRFLRPIAVGCLGVILLFSLSTPSPAQVPVDQFVNFESAHVHPLELTPDGNTLLAVNTANNTLEVFTVGADGSLTPINSIPVGHDPISVRARTDNEAWVANLISDTVSIVDLNIGAVVRTLQTQNEPSDIVFAGNNRAFVSCAERESVQVFDLNNLNAAPTEVLLIGEQPRALAVSNDGNTVYAAFFESGNQTTVVPGNDFIANGGLLAPFSGTTIVANDVRRASGPYGGAVPVPNDGSDFNPPLNPALPAKTDTQSLVVRKQADGRWLDDNDGDWTSIVSGGSGIRSAGWDLQDRDVAIIDANSLSVSYQQTLGNILMSMSVHPTSDDVYVVGTDAMNHIRFEPNLNGTFMRHQLSRFSPGDSSVTITDLNPHLNYQSPTVTNPEKAQSVGDPRSVEWRADGSAAWITSMGTNTVIKIDSSGNRLGNPIAVGEGPTGVAIHEGSGIAYVLNKFSGSISSVDLFGDQVTDNTFYYDPTPQVIRDGRPHLYNTFTGSGNGTISCASCHVDGKWDRLAWDLGNPAGEMETTSDGRVMHPLKGLKTTQTLIDIISSGLPLHWRGDRDSFRDFHLAFENLKGREPVSEAAMAEFEDFIATTYHPPNPYQEATNNNSLLNGLIRGPGTSFQSPNLNFRGTNAIGAWHTACGGCHQNNSGRGPPGAFNLRDSQYLGQDNIAADLRMFYRKNGFFHQSNQSTAGFGIFSDGIGQTTEVPRSGYWFDYHGLLFGGFPGGGPRGNASGPEQPPHENQNSHYRTGQQVTINGNIGSSGTADALLNLSNNSNNFSWLRQPDLGLVVHGIYQGERRGFVHTGGNNYQSDRDGEVVSHLQLITAAQVNNSEPLTWTLVHSHVANRLGVDRNANGRLNLDDFDDADNDGVPDDLDLFPNDPSESADADGDGIGNNADDDDDNDGVPDVNDQLPFNPSESLDTDADGIGNNADTDDDGDGVADIDDAFPLDFEESADTDGDGIGDNADIDADNDGIADELESGGDADIRILAGKIGSEFNLSQGSNLSVARAALLDEANFGPAGTVQVDSLSIVEDVATVTADSLANIDIMFDGWVVDGAWSDAEFQAIDAWVRSGGILISTNDDSGHDGLSTFYGIPVAGSSTNTWVPDNSVHPVVIGPFGNWSTITKLGNFSFFNRPGDWNGIAEDSSGRSTMLERTLGDGHLILLGDEGALRNDAASNQIMTRNLFAYAIDLLPKVAGDQDEDGIENQRDLDSDNDGIADVIEAGGADANNDGIVDDPLTNQGTLTSLPDSDNNGVPDFLDANGNPVFNNPITDSDDDGWDDSVDGSIGGDFDNDGISDGNDPDDDNDGVDDVNDAFPRDPAETVDTDGDGIGNNADTDDDGDGVIDSSDLFPLDPTETADQDGDGIGDNADEDDNNNGIPDDQENNNPNNDAISNQARGITLDGNLNDWANLTGFAPDPDDVSGLNDPLDWLQAWMAHDADNLYLAYRNDGTVNPSWGQTIYIDTDSNRATGYNSGLAIGADYVLQAQVLYRYSGDGSNWSWDFITEAETGIGESEFEFRFGQVAIGSPALIRLAFVGGNAAYPNGTLEDLYPDGVYSSNADVRYLEYSVAVPDNSAPQANNQSVVVVENSNLAITLSATDADGDALSYTIASQPSNGNLSGTAPALTYTPTADFTGADSFSFTANDGQLTSGIATININVRSDSDLQIVSNRATALTVDGNLNDWVEFRSFGDDPDDVNGSENPIDWREGWAAHDEQNFYFAYRNDGGDVGAIEAWTFNIVIDSDRNADTGYRDGGAIGADFLLQGESLYRHTGSQSEWSWEFVAGAVRVTSGENAELGISRQALGDIGEFDLMYFGDNRSIGGNTEDVYPDGIYDISDATRFFSYSTNGLPSVDIEPLILEANQGSSEPVSSRQELQFNAREIPRGSNASTGSGNPVVSVGGGPISPGWLLLLLIPATGRRRWLTGQVAVRE